MRTNTLAYSPHPTPPPPSATTLSKFFILFRQSTENSEDDDDGTDFGGVPVEFLDLFNDEELKQTLIDLILTASDLDILDFQVPKQP
jgi:hypothetical protein